VFVAGPLCQERDCALDALALEGAAYCPLHAAEHGYCVSCGRRFWTSLELLAIKDRGLCLGCLAKLGR
jgi:hypothetical protein